MTVQDGLALLEAGDELLIPHVEVQDFHAVVHLAGELDMCSRSIAAQAFTHARELSSSVVVDCSDLAFIDAAGIHELQFVKTVLGRLTLRNLPPAIHRILELAGVIGDFELEVSI